MYEDNQMNLESQEQELSEAELRLQSEIRIWKDNKITKILTQYLENFSLEMYESFQNGDFVNNENEHSKAVGAIDLGRRIVHFDSDEMVTYIWQDIQNDKNNG